MTVGALIKRLREDRGWSQRALSRRTGIHRTIIRNLEDEIIGDTRGQHLQRLAEVFEITVDELLAGEIPEEELIYPHA